MLKQILPYANEKGFLYRNVGEVPSVENGFCKAKHPDAHTSQAKCDLAMVDCQTAGSCEDLCNTNPRNPATMF